MVPDASEISAFDDPRGPGAIRYWQKSISLSVINRRLVESWRMIVATTVIAILVGIAQISMRGPTYVATMDLLPSEADLTGNSNLSGNGAFGLIAGLSGLQANSVPKFVQFQTALASPDVAKILDRKFNLVCRVYVGECDPVTRQWTPRTDLRARISTILAALQGLPDPTLRRTPADLAGYIGDSIKIATDKTNIAHLTYANRDPQFASEFLSMVQRTTSDYLKEQDRRVLQQYVDYLSKEIAVTTSVEQRQALGTLLLEQDQRLMLSNVNAPYAAAVLSGPDVAPRSLAAVTLVIFTAIGFVLGIAMALIPIEPLFSKFGSRWWKRA
jgi:hypothetical protein